MLDKRKVIKQIVARDGWRCSYCGEELSWETATIDHMKPKSLGGSDRLNNLCLACFFCNNKKGNQRIYHGKKRFPSWWPPFLKDI